MRSTPLLVLTSISLALTVGCGGKAQSETSTTNGETTGTSGNEDDEDSNDEVDSNDEDNSASASMSTSANTTTPDSDTEEDESESGGGFIGDPDNGQIEAMCDAGTQDCPRGQKCTSFVSTPGGMTVDNTHCVDVIGDDLFGESCERMVDNDTCAAGFFCMTTVSGNTGTGVCLEYCSMGVPCEYGGECFAFNDNTLPLCQQLCDPLLQDCPGEQGCYAAFSSFVCATPGPIDGMGDDGATCATIQGCNEGLLCQVGTDGCQSDTGCCTPVCDLSGAPGQCTAPEECIQALEDPPPSLQDVGYCGIPA